MEGRKLLQWKGIKCSSSGHVAVVNLRNPNPDEVLINVNKEVVSDSNNASLDLLCANLVPDSSSITVSLTLPPKLGSGSLLSFISYGYLSSPNLRWLEGLRRLRYLVLTGVDLSKSSESFHWAKPISSLSNLMSLQLSNCNISGRIPTAQLLNITSLSTLEMSSNVLTSSIPDILSNLTILSALDFCGNDVDGHIPYLPQLEKLSVSSNPAMTIDLVTMFSNGLRGYIPTSICQILSLEYLNIEWNELTGRLPSCLLQLPKISYLSVQKNNLNGNMPLSLFQKSRLDQISFGVSGLSVEIDDQDQSFVQTFQTSPYYKIQELNLGLVWPRKGLRYSAKYMKFCNNNSRN
ncbi:putative CASP-like protein PIMP1-like [Capsicum annuum]|nr:putative CASP-like protein PIMP1-like [Capsicum annuum]KAF3654902.1 putative CASP-like protein PIMP1-like [Capsicum annuum]